MQNIWKSMVFFQIFQNNVEKNSNQLKTAFLFHLEMLSSHPQSLKLTFGRGRVR